MPTTLTPYLSFDGNTREAFGFYEQALGGRIRAMIRFADLPSQAAGNTAAEAAEIRSADGVGASGAAPGGDSIMHACFDLPGGAMLFAGDAPPGVPWQPMQGTVLALQFDTVAEATRAFDALSQGGRVTMPLAPAFWARAFGMLEDRFGVGWAVNGEPVAFGEAAGRAP